MGKTSVEIIKEFIGLGFLTVVVCVNEQYLDPSFTGRVIDEDFLSDLPEMSTLAAKTESFTRSFLTDLFLKRKSIIGLADLFTGRTKRKWKIMIMTLTAIKPIGRQHFGTEIFL